MFLSFSLPCIVGCAGPTTPFGAIHSLAPQTQVLDDVLPQTQIEPEPSAPAAIALRAPASVTPSIRHFPSAQVLHDKMDLGVAVRDRMGVHQDSQIQIQFNGYLVTTARDLTLPPDDSTRGFYTFKNVRLRDDRENRIITIYKRGDSQMAAREPLPPPHCDWRDNGLVKTVQPFLAEPQLLTALTQFSFASKTNATFLAGVVAQESGFDPQSVSSAKALGLMQITPLADRQIQSLFPNWPRDSRVEQLSASRVRSLVTNGELTATHDWRLDPKLSFQGGVAIFKDMQSFWNRSEAKALLQNEFKGPAPDETTLLLASYHAGPSRVRRAILDYGDRYLEDDELKTTRRYIQRVKSYCHHFGQSESEL